MTKNMFAFDIIKNCRLVVSFTQAISALNTFTTLIFHTTIAFVLVDIDFPLIKPSVPVSKSSSLLNGGNYTTRIYDDL